MCQGFTAAFTPRHLSRSSLLLTQTSSNLRKKSSQSSSTAQMVIALFEIQKGHLRPS